MKLKYLLPLSAMISAGLAWARAPRETAAGPRPSILMSLPDHSARFLEPHRERMLQSRCDGSDEANERTLTVLVLSALVDYLAMIHPDQAASCISLLQRKVRERRRKLN